MQSWKVNPESGDYLLDKGRPVETNSLQMPAYFRLRTRRREWLYAPDDKYGSDFHTVTRNQTQNGPTFIEALAEQALQPVVDDGRASEIEITGKLESRSNVSLEVAITDSSGKIERLVFTEIV